MTTRSDANVFQQLPREGSRPITLKMDEVKEFQTRIRKAAKAGNNDIRKAARNANKDIASTVVVQIKRSAYFLAYHPQQYAKFLPSVKAVQGTTPKIKIGGARNFRRARYRGDKPVKLWEVQGGVEFGTTKILDRLGRRMGNKFGPRKKGGYVVFPVIRSMQKYIRKTYTDEMERVLRGL